VRPRTEFQRLREQAGLTIAEACDLLLAAPRTLWGYESEGRRVPALVLKTTCRDRWRQVIQEAERIPRKHLLTLQEGVSEAQFREMQAAQVQLVVPKGLVKAFPKSVQPQLQTLSQFISEVRGMA